MELEMVAVERNQGNDILRKPPGVYSDRTGRPRGIYAPTGCVEYVWIGKEAPEMLWEVTEFVS